MPPAMGQPINVVEKPSSTPGIARFETNRSLTGMGHESYRSADDVLDDRPVDVLARRLFESGGVTEVHANGSVVTVHLTEGWTGSRLLDVIRGLYIFYPTAANGQEAAPEGDAAVAPESVTDVATAVDASEATTPPVDDRVETASGTGDTAPGSAAAEPADEAEATPAEVEAADQPEATEPKPEAEPEPAATAAGSEPDGADEAPVEPVPADAEPVDEAAPTDDESAAADAESAAEVAEPAPTKGSGRK
jgi:hypothetical protein